MCKIKIALSKLSEKNFSRKWPSLWAKPIDTLKNWVVKLPCRRSMIPGSRMQLWTFLVDRTYQRDIKPVPALSCGGVFRYRSGERLHGMQEVSGSIPLFSTKKALYFVGSMVLFFLLKPIFWGCIASLAPFSGFCRRSSYAPAIPRDGAICSSMERRLVKNHDLW